MQNIGQALRAVIARDPSQVFLVEGHTDAVGSDLYNLALSDRRAETVAELLAYYFGIPPENLVTQGYGEAFLKIPTVAAERENRRVAFRNITYLLRGGQQ
jgi:outer membrane protein OmpA-like peptidoglycan-associated protein